MVQFVAVVGALLFERLAYLIKTKNAIIVSLVIWSGIVIYAYRSCTRAGGVGDGQCNRDRAGRLAGALPITLFAHDSSGQRGVVLWAL
jgi:hypothetical protein